MKGFRKFLIVMLLASFALSGCVFRESVQENEVGVLLFKNQVIDVVGAGVITDMRYWADLKVTNIDTLTFSVEDPEVLTSGNQAVGIRITIQGRRRSDAESIRNIYSNWNSIFKNNEALINVVTATAREGIKNSVREFSLTELLDDRNGLALSMTEQLEADAGKYSFEIINVTIENITVDPEYMAVLNQKAVINVETEKELERQKLIKQKADNDKLQAQNDVAVLVEQIKVQQEKTKLELEIATREGKKIAAQYEVYSKNKEAFELEKLLRLKELFGEGTIYFIPQGTDLTTFFNATGVPLLPVER